MTLQSPVVELCEGCQSQMIPSAIACPNCGRLVYAQRLSELAQLARQSTEAGDISAALSAWRETLPLLPPGSRQYQIIAGKITELGKQISNGTVTTAPGKKSPGSRVAAGAGAIGLTLWKLKALLFGLGKASTLLSMLVSMGVYWTIFGWKFAVGLVLSIYIHEMGHVIALRRYGFKASSPMFIPGIGALIRLQQQVVNPLEDAEIGLAGPIYGLGAAVFSLLLWLTTRQPIFAAIAGVGAWVNLFNLVPIGSLDGGRGFHAMSRVQKFYAALTVAGAWYATMLYSQNNSLANESHGDGMLILIGLICVGRAFADRSDPKGSAKTTATYCGLVIVLTAISLVRHTAGVN